jgi:hypothetical protein
LALSYGRYLFEYLLISPIAKCGCEINTAGYGLQVCCQPAARTARAMPLDFDYLLRLKAPV